MKDLIRLSSVAKHRIQSNLITAGAATVLATCFYLVMEYYPNAESYQQSITIIFITVAVMIIFPAREYLFRRIFQRQDWASLMRREMHHLDFLSRQFTMNALVYEIVPDLLTWLKVRSARFAVLEPDRKNYIFNIYKNGRLVRDDAVYVKSGEHWQRLVRNFGKTAYVEDLRVPVELKETMLQYRVAVVVPIMFRTRLLGFLLLSDYPRNNHAGRALDLFAGKAAISIQNNLLSNKIIDTAEYEKEIHLARKIRGALQGSRRPVIPGYSINHMPQKRSASVYDYIQSGNRNFLILLAMTATTGSTGFIFAGMLGHIFSLNRLEKDITIQKLISYIKEHEGPRQDKELDFMILELLPQRMSVYFEGSPFSIVNADKPAKNLAHHGWKTGIAVKHGHSFRIEYASEILAELSLSTPPEAG